MNKNAKDWDAIIAAMDDEDDTIAPTTTASSSTSSSASDRENELFDNEKARAPADMHYNQRNCMRQQRHYQSIRDADPDLELINDIYIRDPKQQVFWYIGKAARVSDVSIEECVARQWNIMENHGIQLRPLDLFPARGLLQIWVAPGDSEIDVAYNRPELKFERMYNNLPEVADTIPNVMVGFQGEVYDPGEPGFRTVRTDDGRPANPEIQGPNDEPEEEFRNPSDKEMQEIQQALEGQDIKKLWEEQQRREGKDVDLDNEDE
jgi:hypothetical protein